MSGQSVGWALGEVGASQVRSWLQPLDAWGFPPGPLIPTVPERHSYPILPNPGPLTVSQARPLPDVRAAQGEP